ncbi:organelle RRM domain-containing protein 2, mitochondrial [Senna tora]|uniref:Organelle RRM domain-containing protein 2, mitochondrial n=1 Tax=Senna tora TaxID=362788 RepID=A0A834TS20_9FABA|nr:organelle RRM domain-containing protein 2, mitochondrial [Senna tora]
MAVRVAVATHRGFRRLFGTDATSTSSILPPALEKRKPSKSLLVAGFSKRTTAERLREAFSQFGEVVHARVMTDRLSGVSKGFGFVKYTTKEEAAKGIKGMDGKYARNRQQPVNCHKPEGFKQEHKNNKSFKDRNRQVSLLLFRGSLFLMYSLYVRTRVVHLLV